MKLTAIDIQNKEFSKALRGYKDEEVDEFLEQVGEDYEALYKENATLKEKIINLTEKLEHFSKIEDTIQNTLILAQNAAEQAKNNAQKESELILKNANDTAKKILEKANNDVIAVNSDYDRLKQEFIKFRARFRNFMQSQLETFDETEKDFIKNYNIGNVVSEDNNKKDLEDDKILEIKNIEEESLNSDELNEIKRFFVKDK